jgi:hypothetical protein
MAHLHISTVGIMNNYDLFEDSSDHQVALPILYTPT